MKVTPLIKGVRLMKVTPLIKGVRCFSIWYQSQRSRVRILAGALIKLINAHSNIPRMRPWGACA
jgi:hypothetical protein